MEYRNDYKLVFFTLHEKLDDSYYNGVNSFAPEKISCSDYSLSKPAIKFLTKNENKGSALLTYVIEINEIITNEIIQSWINHSKACKFLYIIVQEKIKANVESILAKEISNYSVIPFHFERKEGNNRNVIIEF
ncbi:MAG: hypothetical protein ABSF81_16085 [Bacteroidales bacterium]